MVSKEEENFLRIIYLNYRVATESLQRFFDKQHPNLSADLLILGNKTTLQNLCYPPPGRKRVLYQGQWNVLYPPPGKPTVTSSDLDLTLMVCLLRNLPPVVKAPVNGFDQLPPPNEKTDGANIARLKYHKNFIVSHSKDGTLSNTDFENIKKELEQAIKDLDPSPATAASLKDAKTKILDSSMTRAVLDQIKLETQLSNMKQQLKNISILFEQDTQERKDLKKITDNLEETLELRVETVIEKVIKKNTSTLTTSVPKQAEDKDAYINRNEEDHIPKHIRELYTIPLYGEPSTLFFKSI